MPRMETLAAVEVAVAGLTTVAEIKVPATGAPDVFRPTIMWAEVADAATQALDAFEIQIQAHSGGSWYTIANAAAAFTTTIEPPLLTCSVDLASLAAGTSGHFRMDVRGIFAIRLQASAAVAVTNVTVGYCFG